MNNRIIVIISGVALIIIGVIAAIVNLTDPRNQQANQTDSNDSTNAFLQIDACDILTKKVVVDHFGGTVSGTTPVKAGNSNSNLFVTTCSLTAQSGTGPDKVTKGTALLLARIAKNDIGAGNNQQEFEVNKPPEAVDVDELGDRAYYVPSFNQLNIMNGNNWYILSSYKTSVLDGTLEENQALAQKLRFQ